MRDGRVHCSRWEVTKADIKKREPIRFGGGLGHNGGTVRAHVFLRVCGDDSKPVKGGDGVDHTIFCIWEAEMCPAPSTS